MNTEQIPIAGPHADRATAIRAGWALILANLRYWPQLAPQVRDQMRRWERLASEIEDPELCALALQKLRRERFNAEAGAMLATLAAPPYRRAAARAILATELLFDYLDGLTERPLPDPLADGEALYADFIGAFDPSPGAAEHGSLVGLCTAADPYAAELARIAHTAVAELPARAAIMPIAGACARNAAQAQVRMHAVPRLGAEQLEQWARAQPDARTLPWRDFLAGSACSVLTLHALIAAAGDPRTTPRRARQIAAAYRPICTAMTLLDGLLDAERDAIAGQHSYASLYEDLESLGAALIGAVSASTRACARLPDGSRHAMVLGAAVAYWLSQPSARSEAAAPIAGKMRRELGPLLPAPLALMRAWRGARHLSARRVADRDSKRLSVSHAQREVVGG